MEYFGQTLCISMHELVDGGVMSRACYDKLVQRKKVQVMRRGQGRGEASGYALISVDSLPENYKSKVNEAYPGGAQDRLKGWILSNYSLDQKAQAFYMDRGQAGLELPADKVREYSVNASVLNTCIALYDRAKDCQRLFGGQYNWDMMAGTIETLRVELGHTLPASTIRFRKKVNEYKSKGYACLISGKFGNQSARKVDHKTEQLILGIAVLPNKPFNSNVHEMYISFVCGELDVYDPTTGELFNPEDFCDKEGEPKTLSESTINNVLNKPKNKLLIEHALGSRMAFLHEQMPHVHRHAGQFSLSQITMDDVDLTRKLRDTKQRVKAYYAYDTVSQCIVGAAYSRTKDEELVTECFRDMFRLIERQGWGMPAGIEVENHLMTKFRDSGFLQVGVAFPFVHFCAAQNSQEKYAEALNGAKKRSVIHKNHEGIGRFYGKGKWRQEFQKVSDASNDTYEDKEYFSFDQLVADDRRDNQEWNNSLHPNQKMYPGMTRWEVLVANINPTLQKFDKLTLSRYIGVAVETSVKRNSTVRVAYADWWLSDTAVLEKLRPNDYKVTAYYLPDEQGAPTDVYIFQGDRYIDKVEKVETYSRVMAEQTDQDIANYTEQMKKISSFGKYVKDNAIAKVGVAQVSEPVAAEDFESAEVDVPVEVAEPDYGFDADDNLRRALEDL